MQPYDLPDGKLTVNATVNSTRGLCEFQRRISRRFPATNQCTVNGKLFIYLRGRLPFVFEKQQNGAAIG